MDYLGMLLLANIRKDLQFFCNRTIIGIIIAFLMHYYGTVSPETIIHEAKNKQGVLLLLPLFLCIPIMITSKYKPKSRTINTIHNYIVSFCQTTTSIIRGALVISIAVMLYCMVAEFDFSLLTICIAFLFILEIMTFTGEQWKHFLCDMHGSKTK